HFIPLEIEIYSIQYLSWNLYPVNSSSDLPVDKVIITNETLILGEELEINITTSGPYRLWLDDSLSLASTENRTYTYRFSQKGVYQIYLEAKAQDTWPINYSCVIVVLEPIDIEVSFPANVDAGEVAVISIVTSCASEGPVKGVQVEMNLTNTQNMTRMIGSGSTGSDGKLQFQTEMLISGNYTINLNITEPADGYFIIISRNFSPGNLIVWSNTLVQTNSFTTIQGMNVTLQAVVLDGEGNPLDGIDVVFSYHAIDNDNSSYIGDTRTSAGLAKFNWTAPHTPGNYILEVESKASFPYDAYFITVQFQVTSLGPIITNFGIIYLGGDNGITFAATALVESFNDIESITFSLNGSVYYLTETSAGQWYQEFDAIPGYYSLVVLVRDIFGLNDSFNTPFILTTTTTTTTISGNESSTSSSTITSSSSGTGTGGTGNSSGNAGGSVENLLTELTASALLLGGGGAVFVLKRRKNLFR
ncbi:MAG: hypothetical protein ACTSP4_14690, partial [Candidatus Hodarchaeales archaeon]